MRKQKGEDELAFIEAIDRNMLKVQTTDKPEDSINCGYRN